MKSNLCDIIIAIDLAKTTSRRIKLNFFWAFLYNIAGILCHSLTLFVLFLFPFYSQCFSLIPKAIPVAAGLFFPIWKLSLPPWVAGVAMAISSISVISSSLALKWFYNPPAIPSQFSNSIMKSEDDDHEVVPLEEI